jgi:glycosyltransferase involved in cell wall biosynthesis
MSSLSADSSLGETAERAAAPVAVSVLLIAPSHNILGGQAVQASRLMSVLSEVPGLTMTFFPIGPHPPKALLWIRKIPYLRTLFSLLLYNFRLAFESRKHDVLHIFSAGLSSYTLWTIPALLFGKLHGKRMIVNYRDGQAEEHLSGWRSALATLRLADRIVVPSGFLVDVFAKFGVRASCIFNIIDASQFIYRQRRKLRPVFMTNRILEPLYNVDCILRAFKIIQAKYPEASLTIAHDGCSRPGLEKLAHELELANTRFIGRVPHNKIAQLYDSADIYLTTPNIDCMPGSLLECYASGLPIVATKAGGIPYIAFDRDSALLVDINDHEALAERSLELLEDEALVERLTNRGLEEVQRYHWRPVQAQWAGLYREIMAHSSKPPAA